MLDDHSLTLLRSQALRAASLTDETARRYHQLDSAAGHPTHTSAYELAELSERLHRFAQWIETYSEEAHQLEAERRHLEDAAEDLGMHWSGEAGSPVTSPLVSAESGSDVLTTVTFEGFPADFVDHSTSYSHADLVERERVTAHIAAWSQRSEDLTAALITESATLSDSFATLR